MKFKKAFRVSAGSAESSRNAFIRLGDNAYGEAARSVHYGPSDEELERDLEAVTALLASTNEANSEIFEEISAGDFAATVKSAAITAGLNYRSGESGKYPWEILGIDEPPAISTSFTIGIADLSDMLDSIKQCGYPVIKLKLGFPEELTLVKALREFPDRLFRVDANGAWDPAKAEEMMFYLDLDNVEIVEQPTPLDFIREWKYLKKQAKFRVFIDEGLNDISDYFKYADFVEGINIKMAKSGGILEAVKLARQAKKDGLKSMLGCMVESSVGIAPAVYIGSLVDYFDLDGPLLLEKDISDDINYNKNIIAAGKNIIGGPKINKDVLN